MREVQILYQNRSPRPESSLKSEMVLLWRILQIHQRQRRFAGEFKPKMSGSLVSHGTLSAFLSRALPGDVVKLRYSSEQHDHFRESHSLRLV